MSKHRRGPWSQQEDSILLSLVQSQGAHNWVRISQLIQSRSPKQCRERYHQNLKPSLNLNPISPEEGVMIERMVNEMGKRWAEIARRLHGRSDNAVKNWWNGGMNRRKRLDNRRADTAARNAPVQQMRYPEQTVVSSAGSMDAPYPCTQRVQYDGNLHAQSRLQPLAHPIMTSNTKLSTARNLVDTPLPSPSAVSSLSRTDSVDGGAPPSMISDYSSYSAYSQSPNTPPGAVELPPLSAIPSDKRHQYSGASMTIPTNGHQWTYTTDMSAQYKELPQQYLAAPFFSYPAREQWKGDKLPVLPSQREPITAKDQLSLPSLRAVAVPEIRTDASPSPPRDSRMALSRVMD